MSTFLARDPGVVFEQAMALQRAGRLDEAVECYRQLHKAYPKHAVVLVFLGDVEALRGNLRESLRLLDRALALDPGDPNAHNVRGNTLARLGRFDDALLSYNRALQFNSANPEVLNNKGNVLKNLRRYEAALQCYEEALREWPEFPAALNNQGIVFQALRRYPEALRSYQMAIRLDVRYADAYYNTGVMFREIGQPEDALRCFDKVIEIDPLHASAYLNRGGCLETLKRWKSALENYQRAFELDPAQPCLLGGITHAKRQVCDWESEGAAVEEIVTRVRQGECVCAPFVLHALADDPLLHRMCAETYFSSTFPDAARPKKALPQASGRRIRVGYFSTDFGNHPVSHLLAELFEVHDRSRFEVLGFSLQKREGLWQRRVAAAFDGFYDVSSASDAEVVALANSLDLDIAVDLNGYTQDARPGVLIARVAPVQVGYVGFLGTLAGGVLDYLIADPVMVPATSRGGYCEKLVYLPWYQCNDGKTRASPQPVSRVALGLPEASVVYCSFNSAYKITPDVFDVWMRILRSVPGSALFLFAGNEDAELNLKKAAALRGVDQSRLIFAKNVSLEDHLARQCVADVYLDTYPYNAGATASNALRMGLPVLTRCGESFASRYGASLLNAVGVPELITGSFEEYEAMAVRLGNHPAELAALRAKLAANLPAAPLFDAVAFARNIEAAYLKMIERQWAGQAPDHIFV